MPKPEGKATWTATSINVWGSAHFYTHKYLVNSTSRSQPAPPSSGQLWHHQPYSSLSPSLMTEPPAKKPKHSSVYSPSPLSFSPPKLTPIHTAQVVEPSETGVGQHWATQLTFALKFLKSNSPIRLEDLAIRSGVEALLNNQDLVDRLRKNDRVRVDEKTGLWNYKV